MMMTIAMIMVMMISNMGSSWLCNMEHDTDVEENDNDHGEDDWFCLSIVAIMWVWITLLWHVALSSFGLKKYQLDSIAAAVSLFAIRE